MAISPAAAPCAVVFGGLNCARRDGPAEIFSRVVQFFREGIIVRVIADECYGAHRRNFVEVGLAERAHAIGCVRHPFPRRYRVVIGRR